MYTGELIRLCKLLGILNEINKDFFSFVTNTKFLLKRIQGKKV